MHTETVRPTFKFWPMMWLGEIGFLAVTMPRSFDWRIAACWSTLDRAQLGTRVVNRNEFHALLLLHGSLPPDLVETGTADASLSGMTVPRLQLLSRLEPRGGVHRSSSQAPRLVGQLSHSFVLVVLPSFPIGSHVVTHLTVVSAPCCQC